MTGNWLYISVPGLIPSFADFYFILAGSDCAAMGIDVVIENPCDPWGRAHNYGLLWLEIGRLGLTRDDITWLALLINALFLFFAVAVISPSSVVQSLITVCFLISPAVMLGLERSNADLLIFTLLALSFYLIHPGNLLLNGFGCMIIFLAAILKLYPVVLLPVLIFYYSANRTKFTLLLMTMLLFLLYLYLNWQDVSHLIGVIPNITWHYSMGGELLFARLGNELSHTTRLATYCMALVCVVTGIIWANRVKIDEPEFTRQNEDAGWSGMLYLCGAVLVVFSFVIKNSFDYRNIFFLFLLPYLFRLNFRPEIDKMLKFTALVIVIIYGFLFWAEFFVSLFHDIALSDVYIRVTESVLNWLMMVPIVMLAMRIAVIQSQSSWLMRIIINPLQKLLGPKPGKFDHE